MLCQFYNLCEMLCCGMFVLILVKCGHLITLSIINWYKIQKIRGDNDERKK